MFKRALSLSVAICVLVSVSVAAAPLADRLPAGSVAYAGWAGVGEALKESSLGQLACQPGMQKAGQAIWDLIERGIAERDPEAKRLFESFPTAILKAPVAAALTRLEMTDHGPDVGALLLADLGPARAEAKEWLGKLVAFANRDEKWKAVQAGQADYWTRQIGPTKAAFGFYKDLFFIAIGEQPLADLLQMTPERSLAASDEFKAALADVDGADVQLAFYANVATLEKKLIPPNDPNAAKVLRVIGLDGLTTIAGAVRVVDKQMLTKVRLATPAPHRGILTLMAGRPLAANDLAPLPGDADIALATTLSPAAVLETLQGIVTQLSGRDEVGRGLEEFEKETGVSLPAALACLGDSITLSSAASQGGFLTGTVLSVAVKDEAGLKTQLAKFEAFLTKEFGSSQPADGPMSRRPRSLTVHSLQAGQAEIRYVQVVESGIMPVAPAWSICQGRLYVALWPQALQATLDKSGQARQAALADNPVFRSLRARVSPSASWVGYVNLPGLVRRTYPLLMGGWTAIANVLPKEAPIDSLPDWLPALPVLERLLSAQIGAASSDDKGITIESYGPLPAPAVMAAPAAVLAGFYLRPHESKMREMSSAVAVARVAGGSPAQAMSQMRQVLTAIMAYEIDNGKLPDSLDEQKFGQYVEGRLKDAIKSGGYVYLGKGLKMGADSGKTVLAYVKGPGAEQAIVGFMDGHVERMTPEKLAEMLKPAAKE